MRVVLFVVYVGESVGSVGGGGTLTATPPLGSPNGYRFGSALPALGAAAAAGARCALVELAGLLAAEAPPVPTASQTAAPAARAAPPASRMRGRMDEVNDMYGSPCWSCSDEARITVQSACVATASIRPRYRRAPISNYRTARNARFSDLPERASTTRPRTRRP